MQDVFQILGYTVLLNIKLFDFEDYFCETAPLCCRRLNFFRRCRQCLLQTRDEALEPEDYCRSKFQVWLKSASEKIVRHSGQYGFENVHFSRIQDIVFQVSTISATFLFAE